MNYVEGRLVTSRSQQANCAAGNQPPGRKAEASGQHPGEHAPPEMAMATQLSSEARYPPREEARRGSGSEWVKDHPATLEVLYDLTKRLIRRGYPSAKRMLGGRASERLMAWSESVLKGWLFNCQMCGQCILHSTGMTCPMNCPKEIRNGPCGGVRLSGHCEVIPDMRCVWVQAWDRGELMHRYADDLRLVQPPVNRALRGTSAWANMVDMRDAPPTGWVPDSLAEPSGLDGA